MNRMSENRKRKKRNDMILLVCLIIAAGASAILLWGGGSKQGVTAVVTVDGKEFGRYSLLQEQEIAIGDTNVLIIEDGAANMVTARCPDQVCVSHAPIDKTGESIICLPNKVVVTIKGPGGWQQASDDEIDIMVK